MPEEVNNDIIYNGVYRHSVDEKRRVPVPFRWRPKVAIEYTVMEWAQHQAGTCLRVLGPKQYADLSAQLEGLPNEMKQTLKRSIGSRSMQVRLDGSGRITLGEEMALAAGISNQAVLVGLLDRFEIWSPERHAQAQALDNAHLQEALRLVG